MTLIPTRSRSFAAFAAVCVAAAVAVPAVAAPQKAAAPAGDPAALRRTLEGYYAVVDRAIAKGDAAEVDRRIVERFRPDFTATDGKQSFGLAQMRQQMGGFVRAAKKLKSTTAIRSITVKGGTATVLTDTTTSGTLTGADGKPHVYKASGKQEDTWTRAGAKGWQIARTRVVSSSATIDGRQLPRP